MKKLAIIGMVFAGLMLSSAGAWAAPTGMTKAEYRALMLRSEGMNQKYSLGQYATGMTKAEYRALMLRSEGMNEKYGLYQYSQPGLLSNDQQVNTTPIVSEKLAGLDLPPTATASSGEGFDWNDAGIGAALAFGFVVLGVGSLLTVRHQHKPIPH
jgi:hypothetical protein